VLNAEKIEGIDARLQRGRIEFRVVMNADDPCIASRLLWGCVS
jgi:hypothetical protein